MYALLKPPLHRAATFVPPLSDQKNGQDAQWSPKPRKFCFCVTAAARPLCLPWTTKSAVMAQQVAQRRQSGGRTIAKVAEELPWSPNGSHCDRSMDAIGRPKEAQWWYKEGRSVAQIDTQCSQQYVFFTGRPMADHCASILPPWQCVCLPPASF